MKKIEFKFKNKPCFSFCQDLGNKAIVMSDRNELDGQLNITWSLFKIKQLLKISGGTTRMEGADFPIPGYYEVEKLGNLGVSSLLDDINSRDYTVFLAPSDYYADKKIFYDFRRDVYIGIPKELDEFPHMHKHTTFQLFYLRDEMFSCSCQFLSCGEEDVNKDKFKLAIRIRVSPSGTFFYLESASMIAKWKIEVRQGIVNLNFVGEIKKRVDEVVQKVKNAAGAVAGEVVPIVGKGLRELAKKGESFDINRDPLSKIGLTSEKIQRIQEQQTLRLFQSQMKSGESLVEPPLFYANSISFPYNLFDYYLKAFAPQLQSRIYISENLYNNFKHINNENPITFPLNNTFSKLYKIIRKGYYQGDLRVDHDPGGYLAKKFKEGITFFEDKSKDFQDADLGLTAVEERISSSLVNMDTTYSSEEIREGEEGITVDIPYTAEQRGYAHTTFFKLTNSTVMDSLRDALVNGTNGQPFTHYNSTQGFCWGCTYDNLNARGFTNIQFTPDEDCSAILKLSTSSAETNNFDLKAGREYEVTINASQFIFKWGGRSRVVLHETPRQDDPSDNLNWNTSTSGERINVNAPSFNFGEGDIPDAPDIPETDPGLDGDLGGEPETIIEPDITIEPDVPEDEPDLPEPEVPEPEITPPEPDQPEGDAPEGDAGETDPPDPDEFPDSGDAD